MQWFSFFISDINYFFFFLTNLVGELSDVFIVSNNQIFILLIFFIVSNLTDFGSLLFHSFCLLRV